MKSIFFIFIFLNRNHVLSKSQVSTFYRNGSFFTTRVKVFAGTRKRRVYAFNRKRKSLRRIINVNGLVIKGEHLGVILEISENLFNIVVSHVE